MKKLREIIDKTANFINALADVLEDEKISWYEYHQIFIPMLGLLSNLGEEDRKQIREDIEVWKQDSDARIELADFFTSQLDLPQKDVEAMIILTISFYVQAERYIKVMGQVVRGEENVIQLLETEEDYKSYLVDSASRAETARAGSVEKENTPLAVYNSEKSIKVMSDKQIVTVGI